VGAIAHQDGDSPRLGLAVSEPAAIFRERLVQPLLGNGADFAGIAASLLPTD
jgi:hypothetical protein